MSESPPRIAAYVPCFNNAATLRRAVEGLFAQTVRPAEVLVLDDGSSDGSADGVADLPVRIIRNDRNLGRGATRARAMREAAADLVLCCDATNVLDERFLEGALAWFGDPKVAAVFGRITQPPASTVVERWRGRHLFKLDAAQGVRHGAVLATYGALLRSSAAAAVGGFDPSLRHNEDGDLGVRLAAGGYDVVADPGLRVVSVAKNSLFQVLERYWRWYAGPDEAVTWAGYWRNVGYSVKAMAAADLRARDPLGVPISLAAPHVQFWKSRRRRRPRVIVAHSFLALREEDCARGEAPCNLDWGVRALVKEGFDVVVARDDPEESWRRRLSVSLRGRAGNLGLEWRIWRTARSGDVIYNVTDDLLALLILKRLGLFRARIVTWAYTIPRRTAWHHPHRWRHSRFLMGGLDGVCCLTEHATAWCRARLPKSRVETIPWGVDTDFYRPAPAGSPPAWFVSCGRTERDYPTLLRGLAASPHPVRLVVPRDLLRGLELPPQIEFAGGPVTRFTDQGGMSYRQLAQEIYRPAIAFLIPLEDHPENASGFTNLIEAFAMGKPVVMTRTGCLDLDLEKEGVGLYVAPNDPQGWARALDRLAGNPRLAAEMGARARRLAEERFSYDRFGADLARFIRGVANR